jgi:hypothetical protein
LKTGQWWWIQNQPLIWLVKKGSSYIGAAYLAATETMNVTSVEEARALMEELPLGQAGFMQQFIELGPLTPLHLLLADGGATAGK